MSEDQIDGRPPTYGLTVTELRGLTRLQQQIRVVNAFRLGLDARYDNHSLSSQRSLPLGVKPYRQPTSSLASPDSAQNPEIATNL